MPPTQTANRLSPRVVCYTLNVFLGDVLCGKQRQSGRGRHDKDKCAKERFLGFSAVLSLSRENKTRELVTSEYKAAIRVKTPNQRYRSALKNGTI